MIFIQALFLLTFFGDFWHFLVVFITLTFFRFLILFSLYTTFKCSFLDYKVTSKLKSLPFKSLRVIMLLISFIGFGLLKVGEHMYCSCCLNARTILLSTSHVNLSNQCYFQSWETPAVVNNQLFIFSIFVIVVLMYIRIRCWDMLIAYAQLMVVLGLML